MTQETEQTQSIADIPAGAIPDDVAGTLAQEFQGLVGTFDGQEEATPPADPAAEAPAEGEPEAETEATEEDPAERLAAEVDAELKAKEEKPAEEATDPKSERILSIARRDRKLREDIKAHEARVAEFERHQQAMEQQVQDRIQAGLEIRLAEIRERAVGDPSGFYADELGVDVEHFGPIAKNFWARQLGEDAPAEMKREQELYALRHRLNQLEGRGKTKDEEAKTSQQKAEWGAFADGFLAEARGYVTANTELPHLRREFAASPRDTMDAFTLVAANIIRNSNGRVVPSVQQVAQLLNAEIENEIQRHTGQGGTTSPPTETETQATSEAPSTLTNQTPAGAGRVIGDYDDPGELEKLYADIEAQIRADRANGVDI